MLGRSYTLTACGPSRLFSRGLGRGCSETLRLFHTCASYPVWHAPAASNQNRAELDFGRVRRGRKKKSISCPFIPFSIEQTMPIFCIASGHIKQNSPLKKGFGYVASRDADRRGGGLTYFSPLVRSVSCWESPRTAHCTRARGVSSQGFHRSPPPKLVAPNSRRDPSSRGGRWAPRAACGPRPLWPGVGAAASASPVRAAAAPLRSRSAVTRARSPGGRGSGASLGDSSSRLPRLSASISRVAPAGAALRPAG